MRPEKLIIYASHPVSRKFPQRCLRNSSSVRLIADDPPSSFQGRSSIASSFYASLLQAIDGLMSLDCSRRQCLRLFKHFRSSETQLNCDDCFASQSICLDSGMSTGTFEGGCPKLTHDSLDFSIQCFTFCRKLIGFVEMMVCVVRLSTLGASQRRAWVTASTSIVKLEAETV